MRVSTDKNEETKSDHFMRGSTDKNEETKYVHFMRVSTDKNEETKYDHSLGFTSFWRTQMNKVIFLRIFDTSC